VLIQSQGRVGLVISELEKLEEKKKFLSSMLGDSGDHLEKKVFRRKLGGSQKR